MRNAATQTIGPRFGPTLQYLKILQEKSNCVRLFKGLLCQSLALYKGGSFSVIYHSPFFYYVVDQYQRTGVCLCRSC